MNIQNIKFRGQDIHTGKWVYGGYCAFNGKPCIIECHPAFTNVSQCYWHEVIPETIGQYINVNDKNGNEIYSDDKVKGIYEPKESGDYHGTNNFQRSYTFYGVITQRENSFEILNANTHSKKLSRNRKWYHISDMQVSDIEVIGNIHNDKII